jgi:hypothetical protein
MEKGLAATTTDRTGHARMKDEVDSLPSYAKFSGDLSLSQPLVAQGKSSLTSLVGPTSAAVRGH